MYSTAYDEPQCRYLRHQLNRFEHSKVDPIYHSMRLETAWCCFLDVDKLSRLLYLCLSNSILSKSFRFFQYLNCGKGLFQNLL